MRNATATTSFQSPRIGTKRFLSGPKSDCVLNQLCESIKKTWKMVFLEATKGNLMGALNDDCILDRLILQIGLTRQKCNTKGHYYRSAAVGSNSPRTASQIVRRSLMLN